MHDLQRAGDQPHAAAQAILDALIDALRVSNDQLNGKAARALIALGPKVVPTLVREAVIQRSKRRHCVRLLEVVEQIGAMADPEVYCQLTILSRQKSPEVRQAAMRTLAAVGAGPGCRALANLSEHVRDGNARSNPC